MFKQIAFLLTLTAVIIFLGNMFNPFSSTMFNFHDETQPARISEFTFNLQHLQIPPRVAPHFSFNFGFPVFNFYAPFSYWTASLMNLVGFDVINSIKLSFLIALIVGFIGMYLFLRRFFQFTPSLLGSSLFVSAPWMAAEIFVRGNLGEVWLIVFIPWVLYFLHKNSEEDSKYIFIATVFILSCVLTAHNILSLIFIPWIIIYTLLQKNIKKNIIALVLAFLTVSYFLIPAILESPLTQAAVLAKGTNYSDHFLCLKQIWTTPFWGYGGSAPGCENDGFSFMLGKIQLILASAGSITLFYDIWKKRRISITLLLILILTLSSIFLTLYQSKFIWDIFKPIFSLFQFPWRFLAFAVFGNAVLGAYLVSKLKFDSLKYIVLFFSIVLLIYSTKFFMKPQLSKEDFNKIYLSQNYIENRAALAIREYLPRQTDYQTWVSYKPTQAVTMENIRDTQYEKIYRIDTKKAVINILYFPFWKIYVDGKQVIPQSFDALGRPIIQLSNTSIIHVSYSQTLIEKVANILSLLTIIFLMSLLFYKPLWKKVKKSVF